MYSTVSRREGEVAVLVQTVKLSSSEVKKGTLEEEESPYRGREKGRRCING